MHAAPTIILAAGPGLEVWIALAGPAVFALLILGLLLRYVPLWYWAFSSNAQVSLLSLIGMSLRGTQPRRIVQAKVLAVQAGMPEISTRRLESHALCGGDPLAVVESVVEARRVGRDLDFDRARLLDLERGDIIPLKEFA
jgi:uncharacterized protein YqfA (UPF0365 family)